MTAAYAVLCPGQGTQSPQTFDLATADPRGRDTLAQFSDALGFDLAARARSGFQLFDNTFAQPAMVAAASATWATLSPHLPPPTLFAGYSVGEVAAWHCAGAWSAVTVTHIASTRARLMNAESPADCGMLAVRGLAIDDALKEAGALHVAIVNGADHLVLAGLEANLDAGQRRLQARGAWTQRLDVQVPSHTPLMAAAAAGFRDFLAGIPTNSITAPVLRGIDGSACRRPQEAGDSLARAICEPIRWVDCLQNLVESGVRVVLELGPGRTLVKLCNDAQPALVARSMADFRSSDGAVDWLQRQLAA